MLKPVRLLSRTPVGYRMADRISVRAIGEVLQFEWRMIVFYAVVAAFVGILYCVVTPPSYEATVQVVPGDFTTKSTSTATSGLANILLNTSTQSDAVKRFLTVLYSPDLARILATHNSADALFGPLPKPGWTSRILGTKPQISEFERNVRRFEGELQNITFTESKKTLATVASYRASNPKLAYNFLKIATRQGDELLRQYNLSEIRYDDSYLTNTIGNAQNIDVRVVLAQKLVETKLRQMDANRSEFFSIRTLGPVEVTDGPVWPRKKLIIGGMFVLGALLGLVMAFVRVYVRNGHDLDVDS